MKVRANSIYIYDPVPMDRFHVCCHAAEGALVRVVNLHGAPKCNTMGHCHVEDAETGKFLGMCSTNSLRKAA